MLVVDLENYVETRSYVDEKIVWTTVKKEVNLIAFIPRTEGDD